MPPSFQVDRSVPLGDSSASVTAMIRSLGRLQHANPLQPLRSDVQSMLSGSGGAATTGQPRFQAQRLPDQERETALIAAPDPVVPDRQQHMMVVHKAPRPEVTIPSTLDDGPFAEVASPVPALHPAISLPVLGTISPRTRKHIERLPRANQLELQKLREIEEKLGNIEPALIKSVTGARVSDEPGRTYGGGLYARLNKAQKRARRRRDHALADGECGALCQRAAAECAARTFCECDRPGRFGRWCAKAAAAASGGEPAEATSGRAETGGHGAAGAAGGGG